MKETLALRLLGKVMNWDEEEASREYGWLRLMARLKFDDYRDYVAGVRFIESLVAWLNQFEPKDRTTAYDFIKERLIYFSSLEINQLIEQLYPRFVEPWLRRQAAAAAGCDPWMVHADPDGRAAFERSRRQTLFVGLSDGARLDRFRRANAGILENDQIILATHIDEDKWRDLGQKLAKSRAFEESHDDPKFTDIWLLDDFTGSGTTFLRWSADDESWTGKLYKFRLQLETMRRALGDALPVSPCVAVHAHHYISSAVARETIKERLETIRLSAGPTANLFENVDISESLLLPHETPVTKYKEPEIWDLTERYYDEGLSEELKEHLEKSGIPDVKRGYAEAALPVVLEHNCPNNTIAMVWAETEGRTGDPARHPMTPLFRRRHRHS